MDVIKTQGLEEWRDQYLLAHPDAALKLATAQEEAAAQEGVCEVR